MWSVITRFQKYNFYRYNWPKIQRNNHLYRVNHFRRKAGRAAGRLFVEEAASRLRTSLRNVAQAVLTIVSHRSEFLRQEFMAVLFLDESGPAGKARDFAVQRIGITGEFGRASFFDDWIGRPFGISKRRTTAGISAVNESSPDIDIRRDSWNIARDDSSLFLHSSFIRRSSRHVYLLTVIQIIIASIDKY